MPEAPAAVSGAIDAEFFGAGVRTRARVKRAASPLDLRGPFTGRAHTRYALRNVTCGIFAGDAYEVRLRAHPGARASIGTTSATKAHAMPGGTASTSVLLESAPDAVLAYFDGPTILQGESGLEQHVDIRSVGGLALYAEVLVLGRLASGEHLRFTRLSSELCVRDADGCDLFLERYELRPPRDRESLVNASLPVLCKVVLAGAGRQHIGLLDDACCDAAEMYAGADVLPRDCGLVIRGAADCLEPAVTLVERVIALAMDGELAPLSV